MNTLRVSLLILGINVITGSSVALYYKWKSFEHSSKMFQEGYKEALKDCK